MLFLQVLLGCHLTALYDFGKRWSRVADHHNAQGPASLLPMPTEESQDLVQRCRPSHACCHHPSIHPMTATQPFHLHSQVLPGPVSQALSRAKPVVVDEVQGCRPFHPPSLRRLPPTSSSTLQFQAFHLHPPSKLCRSTHTKAKERKE